MPGLREVGQGAVALETETEGAQRYKFLTCKG
jgi:hypothetical protein